MSDHHKYDGFGAVAGAPGGAAGSTCAGRGRCRFFQICTSAAVEAVAAANLTPLELGVMAYVNPTDGEPDLDQSALAAQMGIDRNTISQLVGSLETKGLVERRVSATDGHVRLVRLTRRGEKLFITLHASAVKLQHHVLDACSSPTSTSCSFHLLVRVIEANPDRARPGAGRRKRSTNGHTE